MGGHLTQNSSAPVAGGHQKRKSYQELESKNLLQGVL
jgi:hypothetical protein